MMEDNRPGHYVTFFEYAGGIIMELEKQADQLERIRTKLEQALCKDAEFAEFGASSHRYKLKEKLTAGELADWEAQYGIRLPEPFARFLTEIGNGGAGPYYGIYPLAQATSYTELPALQGRAALHPGMTAEEWNLLTEPLTGERDISDEEYEEARNKALGGMLCIGTQGCEYEMYLVLEGEHRGGLCIPRNFSLTARSSSSMKITSWTGTSAGWMRLFWIMTTHGLAAGCRVTRIRLFSCIGTLLTGSCRPRRWRPCSSSSESPRRPWNS